MLSTKVLNVQIPEQPNGQATARIPGWQLVGRQVKMFAHQHLRSHFAETAVSCCVISHVQRVLKSITIVCRCLGLLWNLLESLVTQRPYLLVDVSWAVFKDSGCKPVFHFTLFSYLQIICLSLCARNLGANKYLWRSMAAIATWHELLPSCCLRSCPM